jgi:hypothetical protein
MIPDGFYMVNLNIMICCHVDDISLKNPIKYKYLLVLTKINNILFFIKSDITQKSVFVKYFWLDIFPY